MKIEEIGQLTQYEAMPKDGPFYMSAVKYGSGAWCAGPASHDKAFVLQALANYTGVNAARIYSVTVPMPSLPVA